MANESTSLIQKEGEDETKITSNEKANIFSETRITLDAKNELNHIKSAAFLLRDAISLSRETSLFAHNDYLISINPITGSSECSDNRYSMFCRHILTQPLVSNLLNLCVIGLVVISFIEPPIWCRDFSPYDKQSNLTLEGCSVALYMTGKPAFYVDDSEDESQYYYPSLRTDILSVKQALVLESILLSFIIIHTVSCIVKDGFSLQNYLMLNFRGGNVDNLISRNMKNIRIFRIIRFISLLFLAKGIISELLFTSIQPRTAIFFRLLMFISFSTGVQRELMIAIELIPSLASVSIVLAIVIGFYGLMGVVIFYDTQEGALHFSNWIESIWTLWTSMTTVIYPNVMMAGYNKNRFVPLYFVSFMMITFFFLFNVILGVVVTGYNASDGKIEKEMELSRTKYLKKAFDLITKRDNTEYVTREQLLEIFMILNKECDEIQYIPRNKAEILFNMLNQDGSDMLDLDEFMNFTTVMLLEFEEIQPTWLETRFPSIIDDNRYKEIHKIVCSPLFDNVIDIIVVINTIVVITQSYPELFSSDYNNARNSKINDALIDTPWEIVETIFTLIYVAEMLLKITMLGWKKYSSNIRNLFDAFITVLAVVATILVYSPTGFSNNDLIRFILMSRVLRVFRFVMIIKPFKVMSRAFIGVLPAARRIAALLFCIVYTFSAIGMILFGGRITRDPDNPLSYQFEGTAFAHNLYWSNNFNDLLSGINVCFNLLVINNWNEMESGLVAISNRYCRYFFLLFFICGVIIVNNLVVAVVLDFFIQELDAEEDKEERESRCGFKKLQSNGTKIMFDGEKSPQAKVPRKYVANIRRGFTDQQKKKLLGKLIP